MIIRTLSEIFDSSDKKKCAYLKDNERSTFCEPVSKDAGYVRIVDKHRKETSQDRTKSCLDKVSPLSATKGLPKGTLQSGFTITEVLAAIVVSTILIAMAAVAIITFYTKYSELSAFARLQQDAFDAVETVKYGYPFDLEHDYTFMGIANARRVTLETAGAQHGIHTGIMCYPVDEQTGGTHDYVRYFYDRDARAIRVQSLQGIRFYQDQIFPKRGDPHMEVTNFELTSLTGEENPRVINLKLKARVNISEDRWRYVTYETQIALGR